MSGQPYRRRLIGLPIQRSSFAEIHRAGHLLGLDDALRDGRFDARLDDAGDLYISRSQAATLANALATRLTPDTADRLERSHRAVCDGLTQDTERAAEASSSCAPADARALLASLGSRTGQVIQLGLLARFVPDAILGALRAAGDRDPPPYPSRSAGTELSAALARLLADCSDRGWAADELAAAWPRVDREVATLVRAFCRRHTGFGPLPWESPGYERPAYALARLRSTFQGIAPSQVTVRTAALQDGHAERDATASGQAPAGPIRRLLAFWLEFLERETWLVRRAFHRGMAPLLRVVVAEARSRGVSLEPAHVLFLDLEVVAGGPIQPAQVRDALDRMRRYLADESYLRMHEVSPARLAEVLAAP
jgi:hypothetical protein